ncbi:histone-lysine N-methyltransferase SMYD3 [Nelusetta ayraudi]|uniref:histone-lysine N-methyltransferase SMYD3 n=1 Tax=Nelusetta ayraudi TaxID=303726 RepID=UPI003F6F2AA0
MAPKLERFTSPGKGNGLRATASIRRGELLLSAEPLASCVSGRRAREVCHHCFTRHESLSRCSQCKMARYCSTACQRQAWSVHRTECTCLRSLLPRIPTDSVRLSARIIFALSSSCKGSSEELYTLEEHEAHLSLMSEQKKQGLAQLAGMLEVYLQQEATPELPPSCRELLTLIAKVTCNCFTISDGELREIGVGLYPSLSLLNHDCRPNCVMVFQGTKLQLRAVREISSQEELTISYVETLSLTEDRQRQLEEQYQFTCQCQHCVCHGNDALMLSGDESPQRHLKEALLTLEELKEKSEWQLLLERGRHLLASVAQEVPEENVYKLKMTDLALDASIELGHWEEALQYGQKTLPAYRQYFPDPHPVHGVQLVRVGKLQHYLTHTEEALDTFNQAYQILKVTHGGDHLMTKDVLMKMEECRIEMAG